MYVSDSLFYLQQLMGGSEENRQIFAMRYSEIIEQTEHPKKQESASEIRERMISKSLALTGGSNT